MLILKIIQPNINARYPFRNLTENTTHYKPNFLLVMNIADIIGRVRNMQDDMKKMREELEKTQIVSESGAGLVKVTMTGDNKVRSVEIDDSLFADKKMMTDLIIAAVNGAHEKVQERLSENMKSLQGGLPDIPGLDMFK